MQFIPGNSGDEFFGILGAQCAELFIAFCGSKHVGRANDFDSRTDWQTLGKLDEKLLNVGC